MVDANLCTVEFFSSLPIDWNTRMTTVEGGAQKEEGDSKRRSGEEPGRMVEPNASAKAKTAINKDKRVDGSRLSIARDQGTKVKFRVGKKLVCYGYQRPDGCTNTSCNYSHVYAYCEGSHRFETYQEHVAD